MSCYITSDDKSYEKAKHTTDWPDFRIILSLQTNPWQDDIISIFKYM